MLSITTIKFVLIFLALVLFRSLSCAGVFVGNGSEPPTNVKTSNDSLNSKTENGFVTIHVGGLMSEFTRDKDLLFNPFDRNGLRSLRGGLTFGLIDRRFYQMRLEVGYVGKGAKEFFSKSSSGINSTINMHYAQLTWLPLVLKSGFGKAGFHLAAGGYGAYLLHKKADFKNADNIAFDGLFDPPFKKHDYGVSIGAGAYFKQHLIEVRLEQGLVPLYMYIDDRSIFNRNLSLILHF